MRIEGPHVSFVDLLVATEALQNHAQVLSANAFRREVNVLIDLAHELLPTDTVLSNTLMVAKSLNLIGNPDLALSKLRSVLLLREARR
jgi:hypothetical protein